MSRNPHHDITRKRRRRRRNEAWGWPEEEPWDDTDSAVFATY